jgi:hypothetical protein
VVVVSNLAAGPHRLTAVYTDGRFNSGRSPPVSISLTPIALRNLQFQPGSQFQFTVTGLTTGRNYLVQVASNLLNWTSVTTNAASSNRMDFVAPGQATPGSRFYRVLQTLP